jgi:hypothetical protein
VDVQDAGEGQAAEACTDDRDLGRHDVPFTTQLEHCSRTSWNIVPTVSR